MKIGYNGATIGGGCVIHRNHRAPILVLRLHHLADESDFWRRFPLLADLSGCNGHYEFVLCVGVKAKTMLNNLPLLSVLAIRWSLLLVILGPALA